MHSVSRVSSGVWNTFIRYERAVLCRIDRCCVTNRPALVLWFRTFVNFITNVGHCTIYFSQLSLIYIVRPSFSKSLLYLCVCMYISLPVRFWPSCFQKRINRGSKKEGSSEYHALRVCLSLSVCLCLHPFKLWNRFTKFLETLYENSPLEDTPTPDILPATVNNMADARSCNVVAALPPHTLGRGTDM